MKKLLLILLSCVSASAVTTPNTSLMQGGAADETLSDHWIYIEPGAAIVPQGGQNVATGVSPDWNNSVSYAPPKSGNAASNQLVKGDDTRLGNAMLLFGYPLNDIYGGLETGVANALMFDPLSGWWVLVPQEYLATNAVQFQGQVVDGAVPVAGDVYKYDGSKWVATTVPGVAGPQGAAATVTTDGAYALAPGQNPIVNNVGSTSAAVFHFGIPQGIQGVPGPTGPPGTGGTNATISIGSVYAEPYGNTPAVWNTGNGVAAVFNFDLVTGPAGAQGIQGVPGTGGTSSDVIIGTVATLAPGSSATVTNSGTIYHAVLNFGLPAGTNGTNGTNSTVAVGTTTTGSPGSNATVTNSGSSNAAVFNFTIPRGDAGQGATITTGTVTSVPYGTAPTATNVGTTTNALINFQLETGPQGPPGTVSIPGANGDLVVISGSEGVDSGVLASSLAPNSSLLALSAVVTTATASQATDEANIALLTGSAAANATAMAALSGSQASTASALALSQGILTTATAGILTLQTGLTTADGILSTATSNIFTLQNGLTTADGILSTATSNIFNLQNAGYQTAAQVAAAIASGTAGAFSGTIPISGVTSLSSSLAAILSSIPTDDGQLTNGAGYITSGGTAASISGTIPSTKVSGLPTNLSSFTNGPGYENGLGVNSLIQSITIANTAFVAPAPIGNDTTAILGYPNMPFATINKAGQTATAHFVIASSGTYYGVYVYPGDYPITSATNPDICYTGVRYWLCDGVRTDALNGGFGFNGPGNVWVTDGMNGDYSIQGYGQVHAIMGGTMTGWAAGDTNTAVYLNCGTGRGYFEFQTIQPTGTYEPALTIITNGNAAASRVKVRGATSNPYLATPAASGTYTGLVNLEPTCASPGTAPIFAQFESWLQTTGDLFGETQATLTYPGQTIISAPGIYGANAVFAGGPGGLDYLLTSDFIQSNYIDDSMSAGVFQAVVNVKQISGDIGALSRSDQITINNANIVTPAGLPLWGTGVGATAARIALNSCYIDGPQNPSGGAYGHVYLNNCKWTNTTSNTALLTLSGSNSGVRISGGLEAYTTGTTAAVTGTTTWYPGAGATITNNIAKPSSVTMSNGTWTQDTTIAP